MSKNAVDSEKRPRPLKSVITTYLEYYNMMRAEASNQKVEF